MPELRYYHIGILTDKELPKEDYKPESEIWPHNAKFKI